MHWINTYLATVLVNTKKIQGVEQALADAKFAGEARVGRSSRGWVEIEFTLEARSLAHASTAAASLARRATGADPIACHIITRTEHAALVAAAASPRQRLRGTVDEEALVPTPRMPA